MPRPSWFAARATQAAQDAVVSGAARAVGEGPAHLLGHALRAGPAEALTGPLSGVAQSLMRKGDRLERPGGAGQGTAGAATEQRGGSAGAGKASGEAFPAGPQEAGLASTPEEAA